MAFIYEVYTVCVRVFLLPELTIGNYREVVFIPYFRPYASPADGAPINT